MQAESHAIRKQHWPADALGKALDPRDLVDRATDQAKREALLRADIAEDHVSQMQPETERKGLPDGLIGLLERNQSAMSLDGCAACLRMNTGSSLTTCSGR